MSDEDASRLAMYELLFDEVDKAELPNLVGELVLAAYDGDDELAAAVGGAAADREKSSGTARQARQRPGASQVPGVFLRSVQVRSFRGIGPAATLSLKTGRGLTLVMGRNGSGKSSFAEAIELALTGVNQRWSHGPDAARRASRGGWQNLHHHEAPRLAVTFDVEGIERGVTVTRSWQPGAELDQARSIYQEFGRPARDLADTSWPELLNLHGPFLSYAELGGVVTTAPTAMHKRLASILGLEALTDAELRLTNVRKPFDDRVKQVKTERTALLPRLEALADSRAAQVGAALASPQAKRWDLDTVEGIATGTAPSAAPGPDTDLLGDLVGLEIPDIAAVTEAVGLLQAAMKAVNDLAGTATAEASTLAGLLRAALDHHIAHGTGTCPVCGVGALDDVWRAATAAEVLRLEERAREATAAPAELNRQHARCRALIAEVPTVLVTAARVDRESDAELAASAAAALAAWRAWADLRDLVEPGELADALLTRHAPLEATLRATIDLALARQHHRDTVWQPFAAEVAAWVSRARAARAAQPALDALDDARGWLRTTVKRLQDERIRPFADQTAEIWETLRQESNVELGPVRLQGTGNQRKVVLDVTVDGEASSALGVMSQGEIHALGLALFLPRATVETSPFRFVVIDDPVQAMDPAKVDGLAKVLLDVAETRQVVVFTHDDRLPEAIRRLAPRDSSPVFWEVVRREGSVVELRETLDPVRRNLDDAGSLVRTDHLPEDIKASSVAGFCRDAVEAACIDVVRRRRLAAGRPHTEVDDTLRSADTVHKKVTLALFDNDDQGSEVMRTLHTRFGRWSADTLRAVKEGPHQGHVGDLSDLVRDSRALVKRLRAL